MKMAYLLQDIAQGFLLDAEAFFKKQHKTLKQSEKHNFGKALEATHKAKILAARNAEVIYHLKDSELAIEDSDELKDLFVLLLDRIGNNEEAKVKVISTIKNHPSQLHL